jgi:hypothetical protein
MILLISSGAQRRYADDIVRALAHPANTNFQFRYGRKYVGGTLMVRQGRNGLAGEKALICYLSVDASAKTTTLIPCRFVTIVSTQVIGSSWIFTLEAGSFVAALDDTTLRAPLTRGEQDQIPAFDTQGAGPNGKFAIDVNTDFSANGAISVGDRNMAAFEATAAALSADPRFAAASGVAFYHVLGIKSSDRWRWQKRVVQDIRPKQGGYALRLGWRYWLEAYSYSPAGGTPPAHPTLLGLESAEPAIRFTSAEQRVLDSRYDLNRFDFTSTTAQLSMSAGLTIALKVPDAAKLSENQTRCDVTLEARLGGALWWTSARVLFIAVGAASPAIIAAIKADQFSWPLTNAMVALGGLAAIGTLFPTLKA